MTWTAAASVARPYVPALAVFWLWVPVCLAAPARPATMPANTQLDEVRAWLAANPPGGASAAERLKRMAVIQQAADLLTPAAYAEYIASAQTRPARADELDAAGALYYLRRATEAAIDDIRRTRVKRGLAVWHIYNMGYVFRAPQACFGIDIHGRGVERLAAELDFLLITHEHIDHHSMPLVRAMLAAGRPVVSSWLDGGVRIDLPPRRPPATAPATVPADDTLPPRELRLAGLRVKIDIGDHHRANPASRNNMLMFQVDCGEASGSATVYHCGDGSNPDKVRPDRPVTVFIVHVSVGMPVEAVARKVRPRMTFASHVLELGHSPLPPRAWRWSFDFAMKTIRNLPPDEATVLAWGERWLAEGTVLDSAPP